MVDLKRNNGKKLEGLVGRVYETLTQGHPNAKVQVDIKLPSTAGVMRQFDVVLTSEVAGIEHITVIEVRDKKRKLIIDALDGFVTKARSVLASKGVIVSSSGFSESTVKEAKNYGIDLYTISTIDELKNYEPQAPAVVHCFHFASFYVDLSSNLRKNPGASLSPRSFYIDDSPLMDKFSEAILNRSARCVPDKAHCKWSPASTSVQILRDAATGEKIADARFEVNYSITKTLFFGYLTDLPETVLYENIADAVPQVFYSAEDVKKYRGMFSEFEDAENLPVASGLNFFILELPNLDGAPYLSVKDVLNVIDKQ